VHASNVADIKARPYAGLHIDAHLHEDFTPSVCKEGDNFEWDANDKGRRLRIKPVA